MIRTLRRSSLIALLVAGVAVAQTHPPAAPVADAKKLPQLELTGQIMYQFLLAEFAAKQGEFGLSAGAFLDLGKRTRDPRIVRRAAEIGMHARNYAVSLEAVRLWRDIDPEAQQPRQMEATLLLASGRTDELAERFAADLKLAGPRTGEVLVGIIRGLARHPDKAVTMRLIDQITPPYLALPEARLARAQAAMGVADLPRARAEIDEALQLRPDWELAALFKADLLSRLSGQLEFLEQFLGSYPDARDVRLAYARALVAAKRYEPARSEFRRLLASSPDTPEVMYAVAILSLQLNDAPEAEQLLKRYVAAGRGELDAARFYLGQIAEQAGRTDEALRWYGEVAAGDNLTPARIRAAQMLVRLNRLDEARAQLAAARADEDDDARLLVAEAQLLRDAGRYADAYALLGQGLEAKPNDPDLLYETALSAEKMGELEVLERHLRRLIEIKPDAPQAYNALGYSFADRNVRLDEATTLLNKAIELAPDDAYIMDSKGWLLFRKGDFKGALEWLQKAYAKKPDAEIAAHIGEVLWSLGRRDDATQIWRDAAKRYPANDVLATTIKRLSPGNL